MSEVLNQGTPQPQGEVTQGETGAVETTQPQVIETQVEQKPKYKIKGVNGEREADLDELLTLAQKGDDYDRVKQNWEKHHEDALFVQKLAKHYNIEPSEYRKQALHALEQEAVQSYVDKGVSEDVAKEIIETKKMQVELKSKLAEQEKQSTLTENYTAFGKEYPDVKPTDIPLDVWKDFDKGIPLVTAYAAYDRKRIASELAELKGKITKETRQVESALSTPGSVSDSPGTGQVFFTEDQVAAMSEKDVAKNWTGIMKSMKQWPK